MCHAVFLRDRPFKCDSSHCHKVSTVDLCSDKDWRLLLVSSVAARGMRAQPRDLILTLAVMRDWLKQSCQHNPDEIEAAEEHSENRHC